MTRLGVGQLASRGTGALLALDLPMMLGRFSGQLSICGSRFHRAEGLLTGVLPLFVSFLDLCITVGICGWLFFGARENGRWFVRSRSGRLMEIWLTACAARVVGVLFLASGLGALLSHMSNIFAWGERNLSTELMVRLGMWEPGAFWKDGTSIVLAVLLIWQADNIGRWALVSTRKRWMRRAEARG